MGRHRSVSDADWNQLITLAAGYLALESGDIQQSMRRALAAHMDLISALKAEQISAQIEEGRVTMFVPDDGGVALRLEGSALDVPLAPTPGSDEAPTEVAAPPDPPKGPLSDAPTEARDFDEGKTFHMDEDD